MKLRLLFGVLLVMSTSSFASKDEECEETQPSPMKTVTDVMQAVRLKSENVSVCPNPKKLRGICLAVHSRHEDTSLGGRYKFLYQKRLIEAACVDISKDSETVIAAKISKMWKEHEDKLICNSVQFDVISGNILKFAVTHLFEEVLDDAIRWKLNLNKVDETDQRTLLDYVKERMESHKGGGIEPHLKSYYRMLRAAGAKHKSEL